MNRKVYYVGEGKEIIINDGVIPSVRLSKQERLELKSKIYLDKQIEKAKKEGIEIHEYWMIDGFDFNSIIPDIYNKKLKGTEAVHYINDIIRQAKLILFG